MKIKKILKNNTLGNITQNKIIVRNKKLTTIKKIQKVWLIKKESIIHTTIFNNMRNMINI